MANISVSLPADGETIDASDYNTPINTIVNEFNGKIDNSNISATAAITGTKLADASVTSDKIDWATSVAYATFTPSGSSDATSGAFADWGNGTANITVPAGATYAIVDVAINGGFQITSNSDTDIRVVIGADAGTSIRRVAQSSTGGSDPSYTDKIPLTGTGVQTIKMQAKRAGGTGAYRASTDTKFTFKIQFI